MGNTKCVIGKVGCKYRNPIERFAQSCFTETVEYGGGSCVMRAAISLEGKTEFVFAPGGGRRGRLTADRYFTDIFLQCSRKIIGKV